MKYAVSTYLMGNEEGRDLGGSTDTAANQLTQQSETSSQEPAAQDSSGIGAAGSGAAGSGAAGSGDTGGSANSGNPGGDKPKSMLEAIERELEKGKEKVEQEKVDHGGQKNGAEAKPEEKGDESLQMPDGLTPKAQERFKNLVTRLKEADNAYRELETKYQETSRFASQVSEAIRSVGATPDQLQVMMQYIQAYNSGDLQTRRNMLLAELRDISMKLGEPVDNFVTEADPLNLYPDLKQAVESFKIGREQALEMARLRTAEHVRQQQAMAQQESQRSYATAVQQWKREADAATAAIEKMTAEMAKTDPAYPQIEALLMQGDALNEIVKNFPPNTWVSQVNLLISNLKRAMPAVSRSGEPRPLSGGSGKPQGTAKQPTSMYEAIFGAR